MARQMKDSGIEWIGEIPAEWRIHTASQLFSQVKNKNEGMQEDNLLSLSYGKIIKKNINTTEGLLPESFEGYNIIEPNDIVLRLTDLQNDHTSLRVGLSEQRGIITSAYLTLRNESDCFERYLYYQLHSFDICKGFYGMGAGVRQGLNWDGIKMLKLVRPTVTEQQRIVDFLDCKCAEIDAVIERTKATIEEYKKLKQAVITEAVTKGVRGPRPMKDSGIEWIGEIPEEWACMKLKYIIDTLNSGTAITNDKLSDADDESVYPVYGGGSLIGFYHDFNVERTLLVGRVGAKCGCITLVPEKAWATDNALVVNTKWNILWLNYVLIASDLNKLNTSNAQPLITASKVLNLHIAVCDEVEQQEIVNYLDDKCAALNTLIAKKTSLLTELETYKKSLIYEYVTGKKEVAI